MGLSKLVGIRKDKPKWENPQKSIGDRVGDLGKYTCWKPFGPARAAWDDLRPKVKDYLDHHGRSSSSMVMLEIYMIGTAEETAVPTVLVSSPDKTTRKDIKRAIKDSQILKDYPGVELGDAAGLPDRMQIRRMAGSSTQGHLLASSEHRPIAVVCIDADEENVIGRCIFVALENEIGPPERLATGGPVIYANGKSYQLLVSHVLTKDFSTDYTLDETSLSDDFSLDGQSEAEDDPSAVLDCDVPSSGSRTPEELLFRTSDEDSLYRPTSSLPDRVDHDSPFVQPSIPIPPSGKLTSTTPLGTSIALTQDVSHIKKTFERKRIGWVVLSSEQSSMASLDYALVELEGVFRWKSINILPEIDLRLCTDVAEDIGPHDRTIMTRTASAGILTGTLSPTACYIRFPHQISFQELLPVQLDSVLTTGDCGAAIIDRLNSLYYGHLVAGIPGTGIAYIVPGALVLRDISNQLGGEANLYTKYIPIPTSTIRDGISKHIISLCCDWIKKFDELAAELQVWQMCLATEDGLKAAILIEAALNGDDKSRKFFDPVVGPNTSTRPIVSSYSKNQIHTTIAYHITVLRVFFYDLWEDVYGLLDDLRRTKRPGVSSMETYLHSHLRRVSRGSEHPLNMYGPMTPIRMTRRIMNADTKLDDSLVAVIHGCRDMYMDIEQQFLSGAICGENIQQIRRALDDIMAQAEQAEAANASIR